MKPLSFLNDSFIVKLLKKLKYYADNSLFFHFDFSVHQGKAHKNPYQTQVSSGLFYKAVRGADGLLGKAEAFIAKSAKGSFLGSKLIQSLGTCQKDGLQSASALCFGFGIALAIFDPMNKLGLDVLVLSIIGMGIHRLPKGFGKGSILYKWYSKIFKAGDEQ